MSNDHFGVEQIRYQIFVVIEDDVQIGEDEGSNLNQLFLIKIFLFDSFYQFQGNLFRYQFLLKSPNSGFGYFFHEVCLLLK